MKKLTTLIDDKVDNDLREYISKKYPTQPYGKLSEVTNNAISAYIHGEIIEGPISKFEPDNELMVDVQPETRDKAGLSFPIEGIFEKYLGKTVRIIITELVG